MSAIDVEPVNVHPLSLPPDTALIGQLQHRWSSRNVVSYRAQWRRPQPLARLRGLTRMRGIASSCALGRRINLRFRMEREPCEPERDVRWGHQSFPRDLAIAAWAPFKGDTSSPRPRAMKSRSHSRSTWPLSTWPAIAVLARTHRLPEGRLRGGNDVAPKGESVCACGFANIDW